MVYCDFEDIFGKWKVTKYLGGSKWINQVLVIKKDAKKKGRERKKDAKKDDLNDSFHFISFIHY